MPSMNSYIGGGRPVPPREDAAYLCELEAMIKTHWNSPSIVSWVTFNEGQGAHDPGEIILHTKSWDDTRLVNVGSGDPLHPLSDIIDYHSYPPPVYPPNTGQVLVCGEYGGVGYFEQGHIWSEGNPYETVKSYAELLDRYTLYGDMLIFFKNAKGLSAAVYTEITDVEMELNGLMTYDRKVVKGNASDFFAVNQRVIKESRYYTDLILTSEERPQAWKYTTSQPADGWFAKSFSDEPWSTGNGGFGTTGTPGATIGTSWNSDDIWLRRTFTLPSNAPEGTLMFKLHHDEDCEVYINGAKVFELSGYSSGYAFYELPAAAKSALIWGGENTLAVHCHQTTGGQYIDMGISVMGVIEADEPVAPNNPDEQTAVELVKKKTCRIYPNPAKEVLNIERQNANTQLKGIYNIMGGLEKSLSPHANTVDVSELAAGMYFLELATGNLHESLMFMKE
jgi:hypothetical protein